MCACQLLLAEALQSCEIRKLAYARSRSSSPFTCARARHTGQRIRKRARKEDNCVDGLFAHGFDAAQNRPHRCVSAFCRQAVAKRCALAPRQGALLRKTDEGPTQGVQLVHALALHGRARPGDKHGSESSLHCTGAGARASVLPAADRDNIMHTCLWTSQDFVSRNK